MSKLTFCWPKPNSRLRSKPPFKHLKKSLSKSIEHLTKFRDEEPLFAGTKVVIADAEKQTSKALSLEDFELIDKLGKGSFGSVFLVKKKDDPTGTYYAMKILEKDKVFQQNLLRYAKTERNVLCLAQH